MLGIAALAASPIAASGAPDDGTVTRPGSATLAARASLAVSGATAFDDLVTNPARRLIYTIELDPWLLRPYEDAA